MDSSSSECWYVRLEVFGEASDTHTLFERFIIPEKIIEANAAFDIPEIYATMSFCCHVPPPALSVASKVVGAVAGTQPEISQGWAKKNWGVVSDVVENSSLEQIVDSHEGYGAGTSVTFFTYGGMPVLWCEKVARRFQPLNNEMVFRLTGYDTVSYEKGRVFECGSDQGIIKDLAVEDAYMRSSPEGSETRVVELLKEYEFMWDGLTMGPFLQSPPIVNIMEYV